jgi:methionine synthase II (cobalamin-independent)
VQQDIARLKAAVEERQVEEVFMTAASPGVMANFLPNDYYPAEEAYVYALAEVMKAEYQAIVQAGLLLQVDCPDLAMTRVTQFAHLTVAVRTSITCSSPAFVTFHTSEKKLDSLIASFLARTIRTAARSDTSHKPGCLDCSRLPDSYCRIV